MCTPPRLPGCLCMYIHGVIVVTSRLTDTADLVQTVLQHPDPEISRHVRIGKALVSGTVISGLVTVHTR